MERGSWTSSKNWDEATKVNFDYLVWNGLYLLRFVAGLTTFHRPKQIQRGRVRLKVVLGLLRDVSPAAMMVCAPVAPAVAAVGIFPLQVKVPLAAATVLQMDTLDGEARPVLYVTVIASPEVNAAPETLTAIPGPPVDGDTWTNAAVVIRPMELLPVSVNHKAPSGPAVIPCGPSMPVPV
jgi:hypothetical protein